MSALSIENLVPLTVLTASLLGSVHCLSMCGGLIVASTRSRSEVMLYHLGRLAGYMTLGAIAGALGREILVSATQGWIAWMGSASIAFALIWLGVQVWRRKPLHFPLLPKRAIQALLAASRGRPFALGSASAFLPCGWLHTFVLAAVATQSPIRGAVFLLAFWTGTLPALVSAPLLFQKVARPVATIAPRLTSVLLISAGLMSIGLKSGALLAGAAPHHSPNLICHGQLNPDAQKSLDRLKKNSRPGA